MIRSRAFDRARIKATVRPSLLTLIYCLLNSIFHLASGWFPYRWMRGVSSYPGACTGAPIEKAASARQVSGVALALVSHGDGVAWWRPHESGVAHGHKHANPRIRCSASISSRSVVGTVFKELFHQGHLQLIGSRFVLEK